MKKRILFITQDFARTGSEVMLWYMLKNLDPTQYAISVFCVRKGELYDHLPAYIEKHIMYKSSTRWIERSLRRVLKTFGVNPFEFQLRKIQRNFKADIWYINTIAIPEAFAIGKHLEVKIVTHIHELLNAFSLINVNSMNRIISDSNVCICCSETVCETIAALDHPDVRLQHSFVDTQTICVDKERIAAIKKELGIKLTDFVWIVVGGALYMKGLDYVLPILERFKDNESIKIIWIGSQFDDGLNYYVKQVADLKYPGRLIFTGSLSKDYYNYLSIANGVLLLSREESFSLVMIEAAYLGKPMVAFNVGIASRFLKNDMGLLVDNGNIDAFIEAMQSIYDNKYINQERLHEMALMYSAKHQFPKFEALLADISKD